MRPRASPRQSATGAGRSAVPVTLRDALWPGADFFTPWRDRGGRLSALRIAVIALLLAPALYFAASVAIDGFGPEPLKETTQFTGRWALRILLLSLAVSPAGKLLAWSRLLQLRRMIGLGAVFWVLAHFALYVLDQQGMIGKIASEIALRFYLTIGFAAVLGLLVLAVTSSDAWVRGLGRGWKRLHRLVFPIAVLAVLHAVIQAKSNASEPLMMAGLLAWLLGWRLLPLPAGLRLWALAGLSLAAGAATAGLEFLWYDNFTRLPAARIFAANLDLALAPRPAAQVVLIALTFITLVALRRLAASRPQA